MVARNDFKIDRNGIPHDKQKEIFNELIKEGALKFSSIKDKIDPNNQVYMYATGRNYPKILEIIICQWNYLKI